MSEEKIVEAMARAMAVADSDIEGEWPIHAPTALAQYRAHLAMVSVLRELELGSEPKAKNGWPSVLQAAAVGMAGEENGCCGLFDGEPPNHKCCMQSGARYVFERIAEAGGPTLEQCEALARGELILSAPEKPAEANEAIPATPHPEEGS